MFDERILSRRLVPIFKPVYYRLFRHAHRHSMVDRKRLQNLWRLMRRTEKEGVEGDYVEMGVAAGGTGLLFAGAAARSRFERQVWLYDAFEDAEDFDFALADVAKLFHQDHGYSEDMVHLVKGFFDQTLPASPDRPIALVHIDCGGYETNLDCLNWLHPRVQPGGWVVLDNYGATPDCRRAVDDWRAEHGIESELVRFRHTQAYWRRD